MGSNEIASSHLEGLIISKPASGAPEIKCVFHNENIWLTQMQITTANNTEVISFEF